MHPLVRLQQLHPDHQQSITTPSSSRYNKRVSHASSSTNPRTCGKCSLHKSGLLCTVGMAAALPFKSVGLTTRSHTLPTKKTRVWQRRRSCQRSAVAVRSSSAMSASSTAESNHAATAKQSHTAAANVRLVDKLVECSDDWWFAWLVGSLVKTIQTIILASTDV